jgi:DNA-binding NarL/FixJ family response regulator
MSKKLEKLFAWPANCPISTQGWLFLQRKYHLTPQELRLSIAICHGCNNKMIAEKLEIEINTAKAHLANVYQKVGVNNKISLLLTFIEDAEKYLN